MATVQAKSFRDAKAVSVLFSLLLSVSRAFVGFGPLKQATPHFDQLRLKALPTCATEPRAATSLQPSTLSRPLPHLRPAQLRAPTSNSQVIASLNEAEVLGTIQSSSIGNSPSFLEDTLDIEGQTITAKDGSTRWALVEPDLAALKMERKRLERRRKWLLRRVANKESRKTEVRHRAQELLSALKTKSNQLRHAIEHYCPAEHPCACIAEGGHGVILMGRDLTTGERVAIKAEKLFPGWQRQVRPECRVMEAVRGDPSFPTVLHAGKAALSLGPSPQSKDFLVIVMNLLGGSLLDLWCETTQGTRGFELGTALAVGVQMVDCLERLHDKGFIHRDVKPNNFVMSGRHDYRLSGDESGRGEGHVCLLDFGVAAPVEDELKRAARQSTIPRFFGTFQFMSLNAHAGRPQSYRDDMESLVYCLAFMVQGGLPWDNSGNEQVLATKRQTVDSLFADETCLDAAVRLGGCVESRVLIRELLRDCFALEVDERPDYDGWRAAMLGAYAAVTGRESIEPGEYEWLKAKREGGLESVCRERAVVG